MNQKPPKLTGSQMLEYIRSRRDEVYLSWLNGNRPPAVPHWTDLRRTDCPHCGETDLVEESGCYRCADCGHEWGRP